MPALLERLLHPSTIPAAPARVGEEVRTPRVAVPPASVEDGERQSPALRICSACYLTETELNRTGLLGCPRCYETFAPVIAAAAEVLHGVRVPAEWANPQPRHTVTNPWPTRRSVRIEPR
ncbi:MAG: hypothetical protein H7145_15265 [Akkermansiaceae bacterium]|nr:hypothetical protein [Armatimonadota bacterium]